MLVRRAFVPESLRPESRDEWRFSVPCVRKFWVQQRSDAGILGAR